MTKDLQKKSEQTSIISMGQIDQDAMHGGIDASDITIPSLVVLEGMSDEVKTQKLGHPGDLFIRVLNQNLGEGPLEVIPLKRFKNRIRRPLEKDAQGNLKKNMNAPILCRSLDGKTGHGQPGGECAACPHTQFNGNNPPECSDFQNVLCLVRGEEPFPILVTGSRTRLKAMKAWNALLMLEANKNRPFFCKSYLIKPVVHTSVNGDSHTFNITVGNNNAVLPEAEQKMAYGWFQKLAGKNIEVQDEAPAEPEVRKDI